VFVPATAEELQHWHSEGRRRWLWSHTPGRAPNGWIAIGTDGILLHCLGNHTTGSWRLLPNGHLEATFGRCRHVLVLEAGGDAFHVLERRRVDGRVVPGPSSRGIACEFRDYSDLGAPIDD